jgi:hypothetical protein
LSAPGRHGNQRERLDWAIWVHQCSHASGRPNLHLVSHPLADLGGQLDFPWMFTRPEPCLLQRCGCRPKQPMRCALVYWRVRFAHAMQGLQVGVFGSLRCYKLHGWPLDCFCDCLRIAKVVLLSLGIRTHVLRRHRSGIVTKCLQPPTEMMCATTGFHPD